MPGPIGNDRQREVLEKQQNLPKIHSSLSDARNTGEEFDTVFIDIDEGPGYSANCAAYFAWLKSPSHHSEFKKSVAKQEPAALLHDQGQENQRKPADSWREEVMAEVNSISPQPLHRVC